MKHLKTYKIFESLPGEMVLYIKDILSDIEDDGFSVEVNSSDTFLHIYICKLDRHENTPFKFSEIKGVYDRSIIIANGYGWELSFQHFSREDVIPDENDDIYFAELTFRSKNFR